MARMYICTKELDRLYTFTKVCNEKMNLNKAAKLLGISTRQAIRIKQRILTEGPHLSDEPQIYKQIKTI